VFSIHISPLLMDDWKLKTSPVVKLIKSNETSVHLLFLNLMVMRAGSLLVAVDNYMAGVIHTGPYAVNGRLFVRL